MFMCTSLLLFISWVNTGHEIGYEKKDIYLCVYIYIRNSESYKYSYMQSIGASSMNNENSVEFGSDVCVLDAASGSAGVVPPRMMCKLFI